MRGDIKRYSLLSTRLLNNDDEIAEGITKQIDRGVTLLDGKGWYSKQGIKVVVVLAKKSQSLDIFRLVKDIDPNAFISQSSKQHRDHGTITPRTE